MSYTCRPRPYLCSANRHLESRSARAFLPQLSPPDLIWFLLGQPVCMCICIYMYVCVYACTIIKHLKACMYIHMYVWCIIKPSRTVTNKYLGTRRITYTSQSPPYISSRHQSKSSIHPWSILHIYMHAHNNKTHLGIKRIPRTPAKVLHMCREHLFTTHTESSCTICHSGEPPFQKLVRIGSHAHVYRGWYKGAFNGWVAYMYVCMYVCMYVYMYIYSWTF